jgi:CRP/FNR family transcriptional regulator
LVDNLSLKEVPARLCSHILYLSQLSGRDADLDLGVPKSQLAALIGASPETLSRIFTRMANQGILTTAGREVTILDAEALRELAEGVRRL